MASWTAERNAGVLEIPELRRHNGSGSHQDRFGALIHGQHYSEEKANINPGIEEHRNPRKIMNQQIRDLPECGFLAASHNPAGWFRVNNERDT
jgi:hypothetical protein